MVKRETHLQQQGNGARINLPLVGMSDHHFLDSSSQLYEKFMQQIIGLSQQKDFSLTGLISQYLMMNYQLKLEQIDKLKAWLDYFRSWYIVTV